MAPTILQYFYLPQFWINVNLVTENKENEILFW